jgi:2-isopropylmalate synthase
MVNAADQGMSGGRLRRIMVFDTTLRDGEQAPGNGMAPEAKVALGLHIESLGVDTIEAGFPASSPSEFEATRMLAQRLTRARLATFARAIRADVDAAVEAGGVRNHQLQVLATGSDIHLRHKRGISRAEGLREVRDTLDHASKLGVTDLKVAIEDATRGAPDLLEELVKEVIDAGATTVGLGDTCGCLLPDEFAELVARVRGWAPRPVAVAVHCHNDLGLAVANAVAGLRAGADEVETTLAGIGERAGNASLEEVVAILLYKGERTGLRTDVRADLMYGAYRRLAETIGMDTPRNKAIFGTNAFATQAGIHQAAILRKPETYEYLEPDRFGRQRQLLVGRHSGRAIIRYLLGRFDVEPAEDLVESLYEELISSRVDGHCDDLDTARGAIARSLSTRHRVRA